MPMTQQQPTVLVVEDDPEIRETVAGILLDAGYRVLTAEDGRVGLERLKELSPPCLVLLDLRMPRMDGRALLARMKQVEDFQELPVVVMTAEAQPERLEVMDVLPKPFGLDRLLGAVQAHCH